MARFRAELSKLELGSYNDEQHSSLIQRVDDAARLAMTTMATESWMVWHKFEILEQALYGAGEGADSTDCRQVWMVAGIKADLQALGIGPEDRA